MLNRKSVGQRAGGTPRRSVSGAGLLRGRGRVAGLSQTASWRVTFRVLRPRRALAEYSHQWRQLAHAQLIQAAGPKQRSTAGGQASDYVQINLICARQLVVSKEPRAEQNGGSGVNGTEMLLTVRDLSARQPLAGRKPKQPDPGGLHQVAAEARRVHRTGDGYLPSSHGGRVSAGEPFRTPGGREAR